MDGNFSRRRDLNLAGVVVERDLARIGESTTRYGAGVLDKTHAAGICETQGLEIRGWIVIVPIRIRGLRTIHGESGIIGSYTGRIVRYCGLGSTC